METFFHQEHIRRFASTDAYSKLRSAGFALMLLFCSTLAYAQSIPGVYGQAVEARLAGNHARAVELLKPFVIANPGIADAELQLGLALLALGRLDESETAFRRTLAIAPDYTDARLGLARIEIRRGNLPAAEAQLDRVDPTYVEAGPLRRQIEAGAAGVRFDSWLMDVDGAYALLNQDQADWKEASMRVTHWPSRANAVSAAVEVSHRFGLTDVYSEMRFSHRFSNNSGSAYVFAGGTPNADFRPEWQLGAGGELRIHRGTAATVLTLDVRQARYGAGDIQTLNPGIDQYFAGGRAWIGARWINIFDQVRRHHGGWLLRGDLLATDRLRVFAGVAHAPDPSDGLVVDTSSFFGGLAYEVTERLSIRASLAHDDRVRGPDRLQLGLGGAVKF